MRARGFSVLEALVTLVILSMVTTVMMQGLLFVLDARERVLRNEAESRRVALDEAWFRESVHAAIAALPGTDGAFRGDAVGLRFQGLDPLDGSQRLVLSEWRVEGDALAYRQDGRKLVSLALGAATPSFRYLDAEGRWHEAWPPAPVVLPGSQGAAMGLRMPPPVHLPRAVALAWPGDDGERLWLASIGAHASLPIPLRVREGGLDGHPP